MEHMIIAKIYSHSINNQVLITGKPHILFSLEKYERMPNRIIWETFMRSIKFPFHTLIRCRVGVAQIFSDLFVHSWQLLWTHFSLKTEM